MTAASTSSSQDTRTFGDKHFLWIALLPALLVLVLVGVVPLLYAGWLSLHEYDLVRPPRLFIGLENYAELLSDGRFQYAMVFTFGFALVATAIEVVLGFLIAWLLADKQIPSRLSSVSRTLMLIPVHGRSCRHGLRLQDAHLRPQLRLPQRRHGSCRRVAVRLVRGRLEAHRRPAVHGRHPAHALRRSSSSTPGSRRYRPSSSRQPRCDGASLRQRITGIVLPVLRPIILIAFVFRFMDALKIFDEIKVITGGGPGRTTESVSVFASKIAFEQFKMGYATASSLIFAAVVIALTAIILRGTRFSVDR